MNSFVVSSRGTLHKRTNGLSFESDNLDDAHVFPVAEEDAHSFLQSTATIRVRGSRRADGTHKVVRIKRACRRCFP